MSVFTPLSRMLANGPATLNKPVTPGAKPVAVATSSKPWPGPCTLTLLNETVPLDEEAESVPESVVAPGLDSKSTVTRYVPVVTRVPATSLISNVMLSGVLGMALLA